MPRPIKVDKIHEINEQKARAKARLLYLERQSRAEAQRVLHHRYVEVGEVVQAVGLLKVDLDAGTFDVDLGNLETILKIGIREQQRKGHGPVETKETPDVG